MHTCMHACMHTYLLYVCMYVYIYTSCTGRGRLSRPAGGRAGGTLALAIYIVVCLYVHTTLRSCIPQPECETVSPRLTWSSKTEPARPTQSSKEESRVLQKRKIIKMSTKKVFQMFDGFPLFFVVFHGSSWLWLVFPNVVPSKRLKKVSPLCLFARFLILMHFALTLRVL